MGARRFEVGRVGLFLERAYPRSLRQKEIVTAKEFRIMDWSLFVDLSMNEIRAGWHPQPGFRVCIGSQEWRVDDEDLN
jgi:hypothetical protein